jgi:hypothetical protein
MAKRMSKKSAKVAEPALLAGGNPQIAKADGDAPVQAYIAAMPGWQSDVRSLRPVPPGESKQKEVRHLDIHEDDELDEAQLGAWVKQASQLPGERM